MSNKEVQAGHPVEMGTEKRLIVISCHRFVAGLVVIDHVILVKCTSHCLSVVQFAQPNLKIGQNSSSTSLNICATFSKLTDFEMPSWGKRKPEEAPQGQGRRAVRQAVAEERNDRDVTRRLVDVLATLSLVNAAELGELTATVFKTHLAGSMLRERGRSNGRGGSTLPRIRSRNQEQTRSRARRRPGAARSPVRACVGGVPAQSRSLSSSQLQKGVRKFGPAPRGFLEHRFEGSSSCVVGFWSPRLCMLS